MAILVALSQDPGLSLTDLARRTGVKPSTATWHVDQLVSAALVRREARGRCQFHWLASSDVHEAIGRVAALARVPPQRRDSGPFMEARRCYDHLAGPLAVAITDALVGRRDIHLSGREYHLTTWGRETMKQMGVNTGELRTRRRAFALPCLDRTEHRPHVAGALGAGIEEAMARRGWIIVEPGRRLVLSTAAGRFALRRALGIEA